MVWKSLPNDFWPEKPWGTAMGTTGLLSSGLSTTGLPLYAQTALGFAATALGGTGLAGKTLAGTGAGAGLKSEALFSIF